jgi:hypothetical protein
MKMIASDYQKVKACFETVKNRDAKAVPAYVQTLREDTRYRNALSCKERALWDIFRAGGGTALFIPLYEYLNDENIETALNRAFSEVFPEVTEFKGIDC